MSDTKISTRIPHKLRVLITKYLNMDTYMNESDFIRNAIRDKIQRDAPDLFLELFRKNRGDKDEL